MRAVCYFYLIVTIISATIVAKEQHTMKNDEKRAKMKMFQDKLRKTHRHRANNSVGNDTPRTSVRMQRYEEASAKKKQQLDEQRQEHLRKAQKDFDSRVEIDSLSWVKRYPLSVHCKNFSNIPNKDIFKSLTLKDEAKTVIQFPCIPAMILPIALDPYDFASRLFASIDYCISNLYIYKSNEVNVTKSLKLVDRKLVRNIIVRTNPFPIRLTAGWNSGVREIKDVSWYLFCANDVQFAPFQLAALNRKFWMKSGLLYRNPASQFDIDFAYFNWRNMAAAGYNLFIVKKSVFDLIGLFDENMHPAFFEDADMDRRMDMCNKIPDKSCKVVKYLIRDVCPWHGKHSHMTYESGTRAYEEIRPEWPAFISNAYAMNEQYYRRKWGCPVAQVISPQNCTFSRPFNGREGEEEEGRVQSGPILPLASLRAEHLRSWVLNETRVRYINSFLKQ